MLRLLVVGRRLGMAAWALGLAGSIPEIRIVGHLVDVADATTCLDHLDPDVCLLDMDGVGEEQGSAVTRRADDCGIRVIFLQPRSTATRMAGVIMVGDSRAEFLSCVQTGDRHDGLTPPALVNETELSVREHQIALLVAEGFSNEEIAAVLVLSVATVKNHVHAILTKLKVPRRWHVGSSLAGAVRGDGPLLGTSEVVAEASRGVASQGAGNAG